MKARLARLAPAQQEAVCNIQPQEPTARSVTGTKASSSHERLAGPDPSLGNLPAPAHPAASDTSGPPGNATLSVAHPAASDTSGPPGNATPSVDTKHLAHLSKRATDMHEVIDDRDLKRMRRRLKNREAAQRSRQRKAEENEALAIAVQEHASELADWRRVALHLANNAAALADEVRRLGGVVDPALLEVPLPTNCQSSSPVPAHALTESYNTTSADPEQQSSRPSEAVAAPVPEQASAPDLVQVVRDALAAIAAQQSAAQGPPAPPSLPPQQHQPQPQYAAMDIQPARAAPAMSSVDMVHLLRMLTPLGCEESGVVTTGSSHPPMCPPLPTPSQPCSLGGNSASVAKAMRTLQLPFAAMDVADVRRRMRPAHERESVGVDRPTSPLGELGVPPRHVHASGASPVQATSGAESSMASGGSVARKNGSARASLGQREGVTNGHL
jgi:hypothetical protein